MNAAEKAELAPFLALHSGLEAWLSTPTWSVKLWAVRRVVCPLLFQIPELSEAPNGVGAESDADHLV